LAEDYTVLPVRIDGIRAEHHAARRATPASETAPDS
jgi:hypothetical protein